MIRIVLDNVNRGFSGNVIIRTIPVIAANREIKNIIVPIRPVLPLAFTVFTFINLPLTIWFRPLFGMTLYAQFAFRMIFAFDFWTWTFRNPFP